MSSRTLRHPALVVGVVAALGAGTVAPAAVAASTAPAPSVAQRGLLDGLTTALSGVVATLQADPAAALSPQTVAMILAEIPKVTTDTVASVLELLTGDQLTQLLAAASPAAVTTLLNGLVGTVTDLVQGATAGGTSAPSAADVTTALQQVLAILQDGLPATPDGVASLTALLGQVSALVGLPGVAALPVVSDVVTALKGLGADLPAPLGTAVTGVLAAVTGASTPSTTPAAPGFDLAALLALLGGAGAAGSAPSSATAKPPTSAPAAAKVPRARIASVKLNRTRTRITIRISCPAAAPQAGCRVITSAKLAGRATKVTRRITVRRGATRTLTAKVPAAVAKRVRRSGGKALVRVGTSGAAGGAVAKTVKVRRLAR